MWARLARALYQIKDYGEALAALKKQASIKEDSSVWNNLGASHWRLKDGQRAAQAFSRAIMLSSSEGGTKILFPARNLATLLMEGGHHEQALAVAKRVLVLEQGNLIRGDDQLSDLYVVLVHCTGRVVGTQQALTLTAELLLDDRTSSHLKTWLVTTALAYVAFGDKFALSIEELITLGLALLEKNNAPIKERRDMLTNNVAFALAELGQLQQAEKVLSTISSRFHKDPYATATLGLLNIRKGKADRGMVLYREAARLAGLNVDRVAIKQKLHLEMGRYLMDSEPRKAMRYLEKAKAEKNGRAASAMQAAAYLASMAAR